MSGQLPLPTFNPAQFANPFLMYMSGLETMSQNMSPMMGPMKGLVRCQLEVMGLMSRRAQAIVEFPSRLTRCRTPQDLFNEQTRFYQMSFQQYAESSRRMMEAVAQMTPMGLASAAQGNVERDYISFDDPKEANGHARSARERQAA